ncbi:MAG TPA: hypothetical protein VFH41_02540 [Bradyrhizobium sp.]|nr:hypothetical protein [Bradyrhizobium sp.]
MPIRIRHFTACLGGALLACTLSACGTINEKLAAGMGDYVPQWAGGLPPDAPPRPGTAKYEEYMRERERKRLEPAVVEPAVAKDNAGKSTAATNAVTLDPVH